jgi:hypothetical protein
MAELLNTTFNAVFTKEDTGDVPEPAARPVSQELNKVAFNLEKVRKYIA